MDSEGYDLLYGGGYSIKDYYMESGNPRQMRGASELLNECAGEVEELLKDDGIKECQIIRSGATLSAKVPLGKGEEFAKKAEEKFRKRCRTASAAFVSETYNGCYKNTKKLAEAKYESRKAVKFTNWEFQNAESSDWPIPKNCISLSSGGLDADIIKKAPARCPRCRLRDPRYLYSHDNGYSRDNGEEQYLCEICARREYFSCKRKYDLRTKCGEKFNYSYEIDTMSKLVDNEGRVALLYGDVNNLGGLKSKEEFKDDRKLHGDVNDAVTNAVHTAIKKAMDYDKCPANAKIPAKFEIIALGGDDICLLLPGDVALLTAKMIAEEFDKTIAEKFDRNESKLTISVAACVANDTTAITYMERIVDNALNKVAKKYAHVKGKSVVNLSFFERPSGLFPMTTDELDEFIVLLKKAAPAADTTLQNITATALQNITEARRELKFDEEFELYFNYLLSRDIISKIKPVLQSIKAFIQSKSHNVDPYYAWCDFLSWRRQKLGGDKA